MVSLLQQHGSFPNQGISQDTAYLNCWIFQDPHSAQLLSIFRYGQFGMVFQPTMNHARGSRAPADVRAHSLKRFSVFHFM